MGGEVLRRSDIPAYVIARFAVKFVKRGPDECWLWTAAKNGGGYGMFGIPYDGVRLAHRIAYALANGETPAKMVVRHTCDTPACVNARHLVLGTQADNAEDFRRRGHRANSPMTWEAACLLRSTWLKGVDPRPLARKLGVSRKTTNEVLANRTWHDDDYAPPPWRLPKGRTNKLSYDQVRELRQLRSEGATVKELALRYGVAISTASEASRGITYRAA